MSLYNLFKRWGNSSTLRLNDLPKVSKVDISHVAVLVLEPRFSELCIILPALHEHTGPLMGRCVNDNYDPGCGQRQTTYSSSERSWRVHGRQTWETPVTPFLRHNPLPVTRAASVLKFEGTCVYGDHLINILRHIISFLTTYYWFLWQPWTHYWHMCLFYFSLEEELINLANNYFYDMANIKLPIRAKNLNLNIMSNNIAEIDDYYFNNCCNSFICFINFK